ncbi:MAG: Xaa-Pro peptidase family protein [Anaerolineae bacterium]|nr:Xaa-Pro peptidase family protein [Anaerolineae bacterium]NUQ04312.1 aminopeptidase P family protein [Anaerolineae bacterium]
MERLDPQTCRARQARLMAAVPADLLILNNPHHILYLTGLYNSELRQAAWGLNSLLLDASSGRATLLVNEMLAHELSAPAVDAIQVTPWYAAAPAGPGAEQFDEAVTALRGRVEAIQPPRIAAELGWLPQGAVGGEAVLNLNPILKQMRRVKDADELRLIREAVRVNEAAHRGARAAVQVGATELEVYNAACAAAVSAFGGPVHLLGDFTCLSRPNPGSVPTPYTLQPGDVMLCDIFPLVNGYRADFTATIAVDDRYSEAQDRVDGAIHEALRAGEAALRPGARGGDVYRVVRAALAQHGLAEHFPHHAGHGLGFDHPDTPYFVPLSEETLLTGEVVALEPGAYGPGFGARIEHNYLITEGGPERLSNHSTALL